MIYICGMDNKTNLVDVTRLYTLPKYSEVFNKPYNSVYAKYIASLSGRARNPFKLITVSGTDMIYVSPEEEKEIREKQKNKKNGK